MPKEPIDIIDFAKRVERLCDFLLDKIGEKDGSQDVVMIQKIKDDAADLQLADLRRSIIEGLHTYMHGG